MSTTVARSPAATEVDQWLERFGAALEQGDAGGAAELFAQDGGAGLRLLRPRDLSAF